jgi:HipA-like protein
MARTIDVYLHNELTGRLIQDEGDQMVFDYAESGLSKRGASALSQSLPLRKERFSRNECRGFFGGILPEESKREFVARNLGISARNDYAMLEQIGGECAGAVTFLPAGEKLPQQHYGYRKLSPDELAAILRELPKRPLLAGDKGIRLSLAGAQDKVAVRIEGKDISLPLGGAPTTHILKPAVERFDGVVFNEALCMNLAAAARLPAAGVEARSVDGIDYLLVERYDRTHRLAAGSGGPRLTGCTRRISARRRASSLKRNIRKRAARPSNKVSACCVKSQARPPSIWRAAWTPSSTTTSSATTTRTARTFLCSITELARRAWRSGWLRYTTFSAPPITRN